ncbi:MULTISPECIES: excisionase [Enterobacter]|uniref:excisionase n=1 Tax=Enterobacter TaxID=547 RepID=UPI0015E80DD2|nr:MULTISPECIES: excisionase [Enterobacter]MCU6243881.1 excisionase [Enterobacter asburiae]
MSEQQLIPLREWKARRLKFSITTTCLVKHGKLGYIQPRPIKIGNRWCIDERAQYVGPGVCGVEPEIRSDDDEILREILNDVAKATKK